MKDKTPDGETGSCPALKALTDDPEGEVYAEYVGIGRVPVRRPFGDVLVTGDTGASGSAGEFDEYASRLRPGRWRYGPPHDPARASWQ